MYSPQMTEFQRQMLSESYQVHRSHLQNAKAVVDSSAPQQNIALIYNRPYQKDPIFPERPLSTFDYDKNCRFANTVQRLQKAVKEMKPVINSYVAYDKVATLPAKRREPVRPYFNDQYRQYLNPKLQNLRHVTSFGYEQIYRRPKTHEEKLLDAIWTKKIQ